MKKKKDSSKKKSAISNIFIFTTMETDGVNFKGGKSLKIERLEMDKLTFKLSDLKKILEKRFRVKNQTKTEKAIAREIIRQTIEELKKNPPIKIR